MVHHDGHVEGVSSGRGDAPVQHDRRSLHVPLFDRVHFIDHTEKCVERRLNGVPAFDRDVTMEDLLKDLRAGDKTFVIGDGPFKEVLSVDLVGVRRSLRDTRSAAPTSDAGKKLAVVRAAAGHGFPTADIDQMLRDIEQKYVTESAIADYERLVTSAEVHG